MFSKDLILAKPATRLVAHVRLIVKARRGAEDLAVRVHELVLVSPDVHGVHCPLQQVQALVAGRLQAVLGRQVGPQGAGEARVVTQVATLGPDKKKKKHFVSQTQTEALEVVFKGGRRDAP